jgi:hypothetical protein
MKGEISRGILLCLRCALDWEEIGDWWSRRARNDVMIRDYHGNILEEMCEETVCGRKMRRDWDGGK